MRQYLKQIEDELRTWPGVEAAPHRFGGLEFTLGGVEVGHYHWNGMVDIPFNSKIRTQLIAEDKAQPHHLLKDTGWITFYMHGAQDVEAAIWLFRISYLFNAGRGKNRAALRQALDLEQAVAALQLSPALQAAFNSATARR